MPEDSLDPSNDFRAPRRLVRLPSFDVRRPNDEFHYPTVEVRSL